MAAGTVAMATAAPDPDACSTTIPNGQLHILATEHADYKHSLDARGFRQGIREHRCRRR